MGTFILLHVISTVSLRTFYGVFMGRLSKISLTMFAFTPDVQSMRGIVSWLLEIVERGKPP
jgi:hypothetical protein